MLLLAACLAPRVVAQAASQNGDPDLSSVPELGAPPELGALAGRPVVRIEITARPDRWGESASLLQRVRQGEPLSFELAQRALRELADTGRYASLRAEAEPFGQGVLLRLVVVPRRLVATVALTGGVLDQEDTLRAAGVRQNGELTAYDLPKIGERVRALYVRHGYPLAQVDTDTIGADDPLYVVLSVGIRPGPAQRIEGRRFLIGPDPSLRELQELVATHRVGRSDRVDEDDLALADQELEKRLRQRGWHRALVSHALQQDAAGRTLLRVEVRAGPWILLKFEGNAHFDTSQLESALDLDESEDRSPSALIERMRGFYHARGFLDVEIGSEERGAADAPVHDLVFKIHEGLPVRVQAREYPCLTGPRGPRQVGSEIDSFLSEELPGTGLFSAVDSRSVDRSLGSHQFAGARAEPYQPNPWRTYLPEVYDKALKHVQELYRSEGYLSGTVGPAKLIRRRCDPRSPAGECRPLGTRRRPRDACRYDELGVPIEEPNPEASVACQPNPAKGVRCEPDVLLVIPIKLGPLTELYDLEFEGNQTLVESALAQAVELELGTPASQIELEKARRRVLDAYAEQGFAFAAVDAGFEFSRDRTRARARFTISEGEQVRVANIVVEGAHRTNERLVLSRVALRRGELYRQSDVRKTEERLAALGVFSTVHVGLEDPSVPAREKVVVITLQERPSQAVDATGGFSTGEGIRGSFEYGYVNIGGEAIQFKLRLHLGYLPNFLILEPDVRAKYENLDLGERLNRRLTASLGFPDIGLGPLFRLGVDLVDERRNARDYGLTRDAGMVTLYFRPSGRVSAQLGASLERNRAEIFGAAEQALAITDYVEQHPSLALRRLFRVPQGTTRVFAQRIGATWDRTDNALAATRGTLISASLEHVNAVPPSETKDVSALICARPVTVGTPCGFDWFRAVKSDFLRLSNRWAAYLRLSDAGLVWAAEFRWGRNFQLRPSQDYADSRTYPDRLFFLGGMDSLRGFLQDSLIPEDIARQLLSPNSALTVNQVLIRGGDLYVNPRTELRIPLGGGVQTALFVDAGNLWTQPSDVDLAQLTQLRYSAGTGIRIATPIGPLVFDYGFNLGRVADKLDSSRKRQRYWEDLGAFHFSIGTF